ncbi:MAG TPA: hypothetical protein VEX15_18935 [Nocardioidaceae bacterium]|nr:hypothetical protein [Nocardioidaceae bacterium]
MSATPNLARDPSPWAVGLALFAGALMMTVGLFQALQGLVAVLDDKFYVVRANYTFEFDVTTWGWIHLILGILVAVTGYFVVRGNLWARAIAIAVVGLGAMASFLWIPYYPVWAVLILTLQILVIISLVAYRPTRA